MKYDIGDIVTGVISGIKPYGVFVKFEDTFGFCHISNCSHKFIKNLNEIFTIGNEITAKIIENDLENNRLNLSIKDCENRTNQFKNKKIKHECKKPVQFETRAVDNSTTTFDDMLKTYLKNSEERLNCIGKRNQKHTKR